MANDFRTTVVIDRPIAEVFAFLADGTNDPKFSPRVLEIAKTTEGPPGVGTVFASTVKDAGMKSQREFRLTNFEPPTKIRWTEQSKNIITVPEGGYDLAPEGEDRTTMDLPGRQDELVRRVCAANPNTALIEVDGAFATRGIARVTPGLFAMLGGVRLPTAARL